MTTKSTRTASNSNNDTKTIGASWMDVLNEIDESISRPVFRLGLPKWAEFVFSVPANLFGTTFSLTVGPLWIALLAISQEPLQVYDYDDRILVLKIIAAFATMLYVVAWGCYQFGIRRDDFETKLLHSMKVSLLAYPWSIGILACTVLRLPDNGDESTMSPHEIVAVASYPLVLFPFLFLALRKLKRTARRIRPAKKDFEATMGKLGSENWTSKKQFPEMIHDLANFHGDESFPSGDVAGAVLLAIPLWSIGGCCETGGLIAWTIVVLSGLGRMYVLAHHLFDVLAGALLVLGIHAVATFLGHGMGQTKWWHPFVAIGFYVAYIGAAKKMETATPALDVPREWLIFLAIGAWMDFIGAEKKVQKRTAPPTVDVNEEEECLLHSESTIVYSATSTPNE